MSECSLAHSCFGRLLLVQVRQNRSRTQVVFDRHSERAILTGRPPALTTGQNCDTQVFPAQCSLDGSCNRTGIDERAYEKVRNGLRVGAAGGSIGRREYDSRAGQ